MSKIATDGLLSCMEGNDHQRKIETLLLMKQSIKKESIEAPAVKPLFEALKLGLANPNVQISGQTLTTTHGALRRLDIQDPGLLRSALPTILPLLIEKMGDQVEKVPQLARDCIAIAWRSASVEVEREVKQAGFGHRNARVRENSIQWTARMALDKTKPLAFRSFTWYLIEALKDEEATVRECSKNTIVELFLTVPPHARADLRKELSMKNVRKSIIQQILSELDIPDGPEINLNKSVSTIQEEPVVRATKRIITPSSHAGDSMAGSVASTYIGSLGGSEMEAMDAVVMHSAKDLEHKLNSMLPSFEGRESERNWLNREKNLNELRGLLRGNSIRDHHATFITGLKALLEGTIKGMTSLRTSLCLIGLQFAKDLFIVLGPGADQFVEQMLGTLVKMTGATKKLQAQAANITINVLLASVSYHSRLLQHLSMAVQDKNVAPRKYASAWIRVLLEVHADSRTQIEHSGLDLLDKSIRKGLADANPEVREGMRLTYWSYAAIWPDKSATIMNSLDSFAKKQLDNANPKAAAELSHLQLTTDARQSQHGRSASSARSGLKAQIERARTTQAHIDTILAPKQSGTSAAPDAKLETKTSGLSSGPQRTGLGGAVRPTVMPARKVPAQKTEDVLRSSTRSTSSNVAANTAGASPQRPESVFSPRRRRPITEQLENDNWRIRVEGVITLACLLANKEPPNTDGQKITLPSHDTLAPILRKLMVDPQAEVVDHLMAPEVIAEIAKIIDWEHILPRLLLMSETDVSETGHDVKSDCLPAVKAMFTDHEAVQQCLGTLASLGVSARRKKSSTPFKPAERRPIIKAVLMWMTELIERHQQQVAEGNNGNSSFSEASEYRFIMHTTTSMMTNIQPDSINYTPLTTFLKALRKSDPTTFDKNLSTFERRVIVALKKAWGEKAIEDEDLIEEPVADVESVLGSIPVIVQVEPPKDENSNGVGPISPAQTSSQPDSPKHTDSAYASIYTSDSPDRNANEDLTMIPPQALFAPKTPVGFRQALHMVDTQWSPTASIASTPKRTNSNGKENQSLGLSDASVSGAITVLRDTDHDAKKHTYAGPDVWFRKQMRSQNSLSPLPRILEEKQKMLDAYIARLNDGIVDSVLFKKLIKISKEHPTISTTTGTSETDTVPVTDIWDAGVRFDQLLHSLLQYMDGKLHLADNVDFKVQATMLLRTLLRSQPQYFAGHECKAIATILSFRSPCDSRSLAAGLDELLPELMSLVAGHIGTVTILHSLQTYVVNDEIAWKSTRLPSLQLAMTGLATSVSKLTIKELEGLAQALAQLIVKALNDEYSAPDIDIAEIRRSTVNLCMAMYSLIGDTRTVLNLLQDLKPSQQNLLTYYFANKEQEQAL